MKLAELFATKKPTLSFEVFPPKTWESFEAVKETTERIAALSPAFMSVTCGAGGSTGNYTFDIANNLLNRCGVTPLAHLTCVSSGKSDIRRKLEGFRAAGIENILALRGDIPADMDKDAPRDFTYASDLVREIKAFGGFCVGGACYPEGHPESENQKEDIRYLKQKADAGCDFFTTQMCFDNNILYNYLYKIREADIHVPVVAGIMPVTNARSIRRICSLSGNSLPQRFRCIVDRFGDDPVKMNQAGIAYATEQIVDLLANGVNNIHVYSMNKPEVAQKILANLSEILK